MPMRTDAQRLELKDYFRRAANDYNKRSQLRRGAFSRMLDLAKEPDLDSYCKKLIAERVKDFFVDFPEFQDEAINIVYDMCEDQDQEVRIAGYNAITSVSRIDKSLRMRNADVFVQLLQSDDPREVIVIKRALQEHVDLDARVTLKVLCGQCTPSATGVLDSEDKLLRSKLRNLVLQFLAEKFRACIVRAIRIQDVESILLKGMLEAIPQAAASEVHIIITDILLNLPSLSNGPSQNGNAVLSAILEAVKRASEMEQPDIDKISHLLEETVHLATPLPHSTSSGLSVPRGQAANSTPIANGLQVLDFFSGHSLLDHVPHEVALKSIDCLCTICDSVPMIEENKRIAPVQFLNLAPKMLQMMERCFTTDKIEAVFQTLLKALRMIERQIRLSPEDFSPPASLAVDLKTLVSTSSEVVARIVHNSDTNTPDADVRTLPDDARQAMEISRNLLKTVGSRVRETNDQTQSCFNVQQGMPHAQMPSSRILASALSASGVLSGAHHQLHALRLPGGQGTVVGKEMGENVDADVSSRPRKRLRGEEKGAADSGGSSSLLGRLGEPMSVPRRPSLPRPIPVADTAQVNIRAGGGDLLSRITDASPSQGSPYGNGNSRAQHRPFPAGLEPNDLSGKDISAPSTYGVAEKTSGEKGLRRNEPIGVSIRGASMGGEIKIRGAAERRKGSNNEGRALNGGGQSLLARLGSGSGGAGADQFGSQKRKRAKAS